MPNAHGNITFMCQTDDDHCDHTPTDPDSLREVAEWLLKVLDADPETAAQMLADLKNG